MKALFFIFGIFCVIQGINAQEKSFSVEKGIAFQASIDAKPEFWTDWRISAGYRFKRISFYASHERYDEINFKSYDLGFACHSEVFGEIFENNFWKRISLGLGGHAGTVNGRFGLGLFAEETFWIMPCLGAGFQEKLYQNSSIGGGYETRFTLTLIL